MAQINTPKSIEEVVAEVMQAYKTIKLSQTMAIVSLNTRNLNLEVNSVKNRLATWEKEKAIVQEELDKEKDFQKRYKHNVKIQRKNRAKAEQKIKMFIKKLQDDNEDFKGSTTQMKLQDEKLQELRQKAKV